MLSRILTELRKSTEPVSEKELASRLEVDPDVLVGMLEQLVGQGKLRRIRQMEPEECRREMAGGGLSLYGDLCAFMGPAQTVVYYEIAPEEKQHG